MKSLYKEATFDHVVEVYTLHDTTIGDLKRKFVVNARDSREAYAAAYAELVRGEILAVYQGTLERYGTGLVGFGAKYTTSEWLVLRDAMGGFEGVIQQLSRRSAENRPKRG